MKFLTFLAAVIQLALSCGLLADEAPAVGPVLSSVAGWQEDGKGFWYRRTTGTDGHEYRFVDLTKRTDEAICDHAQLATKLSATLGVDCDRKNIVLERVFVNRRESWIRFRTLGRRWHFNPPTNSLRVVPDDIDPEPIPAKIASGNVASDEDAYVVFRNETQYDAICYWLSDGDERKAYGTIAPGESRKQHTFAGHQWEVATPGGFLLARVKADSGIHSVVLSEADSGTPGPWESRVEGTTLHLQNGQTNQTHRLLLEPERPTGETRRTSSGEFVAVSVLTTTGQSWRLYHLLNGNAAAIPISSP